ncbi:MAG: ribonuclease Z [Fervidicoccaceae archaeon]
MSDSWMVFLGTSAGVPSKLRGLPSILLQYRGKYLLLDAGEGTQIALSRYGIGSSKIDAILITHLHGDHIFGLPGLIQSMGMSSRKKPLLIISPNGLRDFLEASFKTTDFIPQFDVEIREPERTAIGDYIEIVPFKTCHTSLPSYGYLVLGKTPSGDLRFSLAYTGDTKPCESYVDAIKGSEVLIHDSTFSEELKNEAWSFGHSTSKDAALIAREIGAKVLFLFHISNRYNDDLSLLEREARRFFSEAYAAIDGMKFYL